MMGIQSTKTEFVNKSKTIHKTKYDYSKVIYKNNRTPVKIICDIHGCFFQTPYVHLRGSGCYKCGRNRTIDSKRIDTATFINNARKKHGDKYDYSKTEYILNKRKVVIICPSHGEFHQTPNNHLTYGCPICSSSRGEIQIINFLNSKGIQFTTQKTFKDCKSPKTGGSLRFDFYIPSKNLLIEYDGLQHFRTGKFGNYTFTDDDLKYTQYKDKLKTKYAKKNNIELLRIKYTKFNQIVQILESKFNA